MKLKTILTTALMTAVMSVNALAAGINVYYDSELVTFPDAQPKIINERTMVPVRGLFEKMGFEVSWNETLRIATLRSPSVIVDAGEDVLLANVPGGRQIRIEQETMPVISEGRLYLPLRAISQATGKIVEWDAATKSVLITSPEKLEDDGTPIPDEGNMTAPAQEFLTEVFSTISAVKSEVTSTKDPVLMELYGLKVNENVPVSTDYSNIYELTHKLYNLEAPNGLKDVKKYVDKYVEIVEKACRHGLDSAETGTYDHAYIDELKGEKEETSMMFGVALVEYFNANKVYYEGVFSEYCLDVMN